jgi:hypothetical protein
VPTVDPGNLSQCVSGRGGGETGGAMGISRRRTARNGYAKEG